MANISVTNALNDNSATSDITKVGTNFTDLVNGLTDGTKDISVSAITAAGAVTAAGLITANGGLATGATGDDVYSVAWTDYSSTSTVSGWAATPTKAIFYKKIGKTVFVTFLISGTSDATTASFTVPYAFITGFGQTLIIPVFGQDSGTQLTTPARAQIANNASTVEFYKDMSTTAWTNSGTKAVIGQFFYETAS